MNKKSMNLKRIFLDITLLLMISAFLFSSCVSVGDIDKVKFSIRSKLKGKLLGLKMFVSRGGTSENIHEVLNENLFTESDSVNKYGYYDYNMGYSWIEDNTLATLLHPWFLYTTALLGVPVQTARIDLWASITVFDSNGRFLRTYRAEKKDKLLVSGVYYGKYNPSPWFKKLFIQLINQANNEAYSINSALLEAGAITRGNEAIAREKIDTYLNDKYEHENAQRAERNAEREEAAYESYERQKEASKNISDELKKANEQFQREMQKLQEQLKK